MIQITDVTFSQANLNTVFISVATQQLKKRNQRPRGLCEKYMLTDSIQEYNKRVIDLACSVCTVKYQTEVFLHWSRPFVARSILRKLGPTFHSTDLTLTVNDPLLLFSVIQNLKCPFRCMWKISFFEFFPRTKFSPLSYMSCPLAINCFDISPTPTPSLSLKRSV